MMTQPEVFKACLDLFKQESTLLGEKGRNSNWKDSDLVAMGLMFDNLIRVFGNTAFDDQLKVLPHITTITHRSIQRCINSDLKIINIKALVSCVACFSSVLSLLLVDTNTKYNEAVSVVTSQEVLPKILLLDVALFEILKTIIQTNTLIADEEHLSLLCLSLLYSLLSAYSNVLPINGIDNDLVNLLNGNLLAQVIQSILVFSQFKNKTVSQKSLQCLQQLLCLLEADKHQNEWRNYFPGIFSGLYGLCCSGFKSGSSVLCLAFSCMIEVSLLVARDSSTDNRKLLQALRLTAESSEVKAKNAFFDLISRVTKTSAVIPSDTPVYNTDEGVAALQQWRVNVLQRLEIHFPKAFKEVVMLLTPKQKISIIERFSEFLRESAHYLGLRCVSEYVLCFVGFFSDDVAVVRDAAHRGWTAFKSYMIGTDGDLFGLIMSGLKDRFLDSLKTASRISQVSGGSDGAALLYELKVLLGLGLIAGSQMQLLALTTGSETSSKAAESFSQESTVSSSGNQGVIGQLFQLSVPDLQSLRAIVLQTRRYFNAIDGSTPASVESGYYRLQWRCTNDDVTKSFTRKVCALMGRYGCCEEIVSQATAAVKSIQQVHKLNQYLTATGGIGYNKHLALTDNTTPASDIQKESTTAESSLSRIRASVGLAVAAVMTLNSSLFGYLRQVTQPQSNRNTGGGENVRKCQVCGVSGSSTLKLNKCSKCKASPVYYCCREHQVSDWPKHKLVCGQVQQEHTTSDSSSTGNYSADDVVDPELLVCSELLVHYSAQDVDNSVKSRFPLIKSNIASAMKLYLQICYQYLQLKLAVSSLVQKQNHAQSSESSEVSVYRRPDAKMEAGIKYSHDLLKSYSVLVSVAVEGIANCAVILGKEKFEPYLQECLYPLLELMVDTDNLVSQAAKCTLERVALYLQLRGFSELVRVNLDYIVDEACANLRMISNTFKGRSSSASNEVGLGGIDRRKSNHRYVSPSTHLIVDLVFTAIGGDLDGAAVDPALVAPMYLLKDMIFDTLENIDTLAISPIYHVNKSSSGGEKSQQLDAMLHVLQVFVHRTTAPPPLDLFPVNLRASQYFVRKIYGSSEAKAASLTAQIGAGKESAGSIEKDKDVVDPAFESLSIEEKIKYIANHRREAEEAATDDNDNDADDSVPSVTPAQQLLLDILHRCTYFISIPNITCTVSIIETISAALLRLSTCQRLLLPALHQIFPSLMNRMIEVVQTLHDTAPSRPFQQGKGTDKSLLSESRTKYFNRPDSEQPPIISAVNSRASASTVAQSKDPLLSAERLHMLPALCEMFSLMSLLAGDFLTLKYREELFPQVVRLLKFYHTRALETEESKKNRSALVQSSGSVSGSLQLSDLLISPRSENQDATADETSQHKDEPEAHAIYSRFSVHSKIKKAVLNLISQMCALPVSGRMLSSHGTVFAWFVLSLLCTRESSEVVELASSTFIALTGVNRDSPLQMVESILYSFKKPTAAAAVVAVSVVSHNDALETWSSVTRLKEIVQHYETRDRQGAIRSLTAVPNADGLLKYFHGDTVFMERVNKIYKKL